MAMECLASGVPVILSANTGQLDFAREDICLPLIHQGPVKPTPSKKGIDQWGETSVEETVEALEKVYTQYQEAKTRASRAAAYMTTFTWENQVNEMVKALEGYL